MDSTKEYSLKVVMLPWLAHGHVTPFLELAKALSNNNFLIYICSTPVILNSIKKKIPQTHYPNIHLLELHLPTSPDLPPHRHTTTGLPPRLLPALFHALTTARPDFLRTIENLPFDMLIHDLNHPWAADVALSLHNITAVALNTSNALMFSYLLHICTHPPAVEFPFPAVRLSAFEMSMAFGGMPPFGDDEHLRDYMNIEAVATVLVCSSREIDGKYMDYLSQLLVGKKIVVVGALVDDNIVDDDSDRMVMEWLDGKDELSSVLVSFGTESYPKDEEIEEIAYGLEMSDANFIWVVWTKAALPEGFVERVGGRGLIVESMVPQARILGHSSIGGFVSHCGWNSFKESVRFGVPIISVPIQHDQPLNTKLAVELDVGVEIKRDQKGRLRREEISRVIKDVVFEESGRELRRSVGEKSERVRDTSRKELEGLVQDATPL